MHQKGMSTTLVIIVSAVVILVTALVLLTIFGTGIAPVGSLAEARNNCELQGRQLCITTGQLPPTWTLKTMNLNGVMTSCDDVCTQGSAGNNCVQSSPGVYEFSC
jgi:hypothetical protein